jgi:3'(2'), 5'-bisphosphate nucleotidase
MSIAMAIEETDVHLAERLATGAGEILLALQRDSGLSGKELGKAGDEQANRWLMDELRRCRPDDAILSEEEADSEARLSASRVWIIDPLDGTREYGEARTDWAVHVALSIDFEAAIGAVALPGLGITLSSGNPSEAPPANTPPKMLISRTRPAQEAVDVAKLIGAELLPMGSAGAKAMAVVRGEADIYLHTGGQYQWDNCAPVAVAQAHGLHCSRIDGSHIIYNEADTSLPDLLICRPEYAEKVLGLLV